MHESALPPARNCGLYTPGHSIHWVQARLTWNRPVSRTAVEIVELSEAGVLLWADDGLRRFWNHDLVRLRALVGQHGPFGALVGYHALRLESGHLICVKEDSEGQQERCTDPRGRS